MRGWSGACASLACALALTWPAGSEAGSFSVTPVRIQFQPRDRAVALTIANSGGDPVFLQAELFDWRQRADGSDDLVPTEDLVLAPTVLKLAPHSQQVVRLALLRAPDPQRQLSYRMIIREVPEAAGGPDGLAVPVALALNLPIFVTPPGARAQIECVPERPAQGIELACRNSGNAAALLREARLERGAAATASFSGAAYLLPGTLRRFSLAPVPGADLSPGPARVVWTLEDGQSSAEDLRLP